MDLLLGNFVKKYINNFNSLELKQLGNILKFDDDNLFKWYSCKKYKINIPKNKVSKLLRSFKV